MSDWHSELPLGKQTDYVANYDASLLCGVPRSIPRAELALAHGVLPFVGVDVWTAYELSWLQPDGKPAVAVGEFVVPCDSPCLIESKSLKLYLNSLNLSVFASWEEVAALIARDLGEAAGAPVQVVLKSLRQVAAEGLRAPEGESLDIWPLARQAIAPDPELLVVDKARQESVRLYSDLLRSRCPVTGQPDWASVVIDYEGPAIDRSGLLAYIVSFREHAEFHEQCVERMFTDISRRCMPSSLAVYARYLRRGGLDINPLRASAPPDVPFLRLARQ